MIISLLTAAAMMTMNYGDANVESSPSDKSTANELTIMSYNVHNGIGLDKVTDYSRIGEFIKSYNPDIVAIQEVDSVTERSQGKYVLEEIGKAADMRDYFSPSIDYRGGKYGIGILSKNEPLTVQRIPLPGREEARSLIVMEFPDYVFACTHLSLTEEDRNTSIEIITNLAKEYDKPFFIAGDFNAKPDSYLIKNFTDIFTPLNDIETFTFPADTPKITIDYIMSYNFPKDGIKVIEQAVIDEAVMSDHRPVIVKVEFLK